jgi:isoquinoline 1-oxidoreductase beta subunit
MSAHGDPIGRRRFIKGFLIAGPTLAMAARVGLDGRFPEFAAADGFRTPEISDGFDLTDVLISSGTPFYYDLLIEIKKDNRVYFEIPRQEVGQGITTTVTMMLADNLDVPLGNIDFALSKAEPRRGPAQLTGGSHTTRSLWDPIRVISAQLRSRLMTAGAEYLGVAPNAVRTQDGYVVATDGRKVSYGEISEAAAKVVPKVAPTPKPIDQLKVIGTRRSRLDARRIVTGQVQYAMDLAVPGALPTVLARPATYGATIVSVDDSAAKAMPGVVAISQIPGMADINLPPAVAVTARTFGQALAARNALKVQWSKGTMDEVSDQQVWEMLHSLLQPMVSPDPGDGIDAVFEWPYVSQAPMETNDAVADVRADRAEIWTGAKTPIVALQDVAKTLGFKEEQVTLHCVQTGGSFGRRLFHDAAVHAAQVSQKIGRPVKLTNGREDDIRHGRCRPASVHHVRATVKNGEIVSYEHQMAGAELDLRHGFGEAISAYGGQQNPKGYSRTVVRLTQKVPYNVGVTSLSLEERPIGVPTGALRAVYSGPFSTLNEIIIDELARKMGQDEYEFRRKRLDNDRARAVLDKVAHEGQWGKPMPPGTAQGIGMHDEYKSIVAYLMECDARGPEPRITNVTVAVDPGRVVNPSGLESQLMGATMDGIGLVFSAGLHVDKGMIRETNFHDYKWARMYTAPLDIKVHILPPTAEVPGGAGELGVPAACAAAANSWARATGKSPRKFPINERRI